MTHGGYHSGHRRAIQPLELLTHNRKGLTMATKLDKPLTRETNMIHKMRPVLITLLPRGGPKSDIGLYLLAEDMIEFRLKGTQQTLRISVSAAYQAAMNRAVRGIR